ncbi:Ff.00g102390.m01.CDS01 [Fusarium sp. VM40]|nr:Ff.00g102390.m01.CDS01 [Fusarium sp. VM40]
MLGEKNFEEGRPSKQPIEIPLSEADFEAMKLVCNAIHTPVQTKLHTLNVGKLAQIYEATNEYDLVDAVSLSFE